MNLMKPYSIILSVFLFASGIFFNSCGAYRRTAILQDMDTVTTYMINQYPDTKILRGDRINITVSSAQPALAAPFNPGLKLVDTEEVPITGSTVTIGNEGYLVDDHGNINFPVLGNLHVEGMSLKQLSEFIEDKIVSQGYINEPIVKTQFVNFNVLLLGESGSSVVSVPSGNINLLELLAHNGGISDMSDREHIRVIRTTGDKRNVYMVNAKTREMYDSPVFYLQQNDVVYIPPINSKIDAQLSNWIQFFTTPMTLVSSLSSLIIVCIAFL